MTQAEFIDAFRAKSGFVTNGTEEQKAAWFAYIEALNIPWPRDQPRSLVFIPPEHYEMLLAGRELIYG